MLVLGLLLLLHHVWALLLNQNKGKELTRETNYVVKSIDSCPSVGYFFRRDSSPDGLGPCRLCFCKDNGTAVCWRRDNKRCDAYHYYNQHSIEKRDRVRRSPGFTDLFFRDATRDFFNQQAPEQCKPYESSFSDDCPPADWCTGCTVCDCDANGRWDCHLLSFCPGKDNRYRKSVKKGPVKKNTNKKMTAKPLKVSPTRTTKTSFTKKSVKKGAEKKLIRSKNYIRNIKKKSLTKAKPMKVLKKASQRSSKKSVYKKTEAKKPTTKKPKVVKRANIPNAPKKPIAVKRLVTTKKPRVLKVTVPSSNQSNALLLARRAAVRSYMKNLKKALSEQLRNMPLAIQIREKRSANGDGTDDFQEIDIDYDDDITTGYDRERRDVTIYTNHIGTNRISRENPDAKLLAIKTANGTAYLAKKVIKKVMTAIRRILNKSFVKQKRSIVINNKNTKAEQTNDTKSSGSRSRSASMKKKLNKKQLSKEKARKKRDLKDTAHFEISSGNYTNPTESTQNTEFNEKVISNNSTSDYYKYSLATPNQLNVNDSTDSEKNYYTYSLDESTCNSTVQYNYTTIFPISKKKVVGERKSSVSVGTNNTELFRNDRNKTASIPEIYVNVNELKLSNWQKLKAVKEKNTNLKETLMTNLHSDKYLVNNHTNEYRTRMKTVKGKNIKRKISKKPTLKKIVKTKMNKNVEKAYDKKHIYMNTKSTKNINKEKSNHQFLKKILESFSKYNGSTRNRTKQYNTIKYLKNLFKKIVFGKKNKQTSRRYKLNKHSVFKTLCETFGPCKIKNRKELQLQIIKLTNETRQIFRNIRTIKGLLQLIGPIIKAPSKGNIIVNDTRNNTAKDHRLKEDIRKLSSILRDTYTETFLANLTQTQIEQVNYVRENTHSFIRSVGKFSKSLNEVIDAITIKKGKSKNGKLHRISRLAKNDDEHHEQSEMLKIIKGTLLKYNLFQNSFVSKMYESLMNFEKKLSEHIRKSYNDNVNEKNMLHNKHVSNNTAVIETYAKNIINNLRTLINLAENLDSSKARTKRELSQDDDAVEYLLMLMEYLLKRSYPLDAAPVNDGIDLLIDAIRNAPDIKPIRKKVLQYATTAKLATKSTKAPNISNQTESKPVSEKTYTENSSITKEEDKKTKFIGHIEYSEDDTDEEDQSDNKTVRISTDKYSQDVKEDTTELAHYNQDNNETENAKYAIDANAESMSVKNNKQLQNLDERDEDFIDNVYVKKDDKQTETRQTGSAAGNDNNDSKYEFNNEANDDIETTSSTAGAETDIEPETTPLPTSDHSQEITEFMKNVKMKGYLPASDISASDNDKKIDWIDLAYDEEIREATKMKFKELKKRTTEAVPTIKTKTSPKSHIITVENVSSISKEITNEKDKKRSKVEDILRKKQMDLLNSLDYGSKTAADDVEVKEVTQVETDEVFPMYFV